MSKNEFLENILREYEELILNIPVIYKYIGIKGGSGMLKNKTILIRKPSSFSDPYDCYPELIKFENPPADYFKSRIDKYFGHLKREERRKILSNAQKNHKKGYSSDFIAQERDRWGISCFSKNFNNLLLWSQYAHSHKGICVGFNTRKLYQNLKIDNGLGRVVLLEVKYSKEFKSVNFFENSYEAILNWIRTKYCELIYEEEIRIAFSPREFNESDYELVHFNKNVVEEIYFGSQIEDKDEMTIKNIISSELYAPRIFKMKLNENEYKLSPIEL